jgi:hypothetical protein
MAAKLKIEKRGDEILIVHCCRDRLKKRMTLKTIMNLTKPKNTLHIAIQ